MPKKKSHKKFFSSSENPFNVKVNRSKHTVLGQKVRGTKGKPGVSHSIGNAKRRDEFHKKKLLSQKANKFLDKRLLNNSQTYEDPATARLVQERKKKFKKNIFNLNDEENIALTHKGAPLADNLSNEAVVDSDDDELLDSHFVRQAHFGGFSENAVKKSRKEIIDEMIFESIKRKQERKIAQKTNAELIEKLDEDWRKGHQTTFSTLKTGKKEDVPDKNDPFDILLNELKFEKRTTPSSQLETPEEKAKKELDKKKQLEEERNKRMNPVENTEVNNYFSADSIYDGLDIQFQHVDDHNESSINENMEENGDDDDDDVSSEASSDTNEVECDKICNDGESEAMQDCAASIPTSLESFCNIVNEHDIHECIEDILKSVIKNKTKKNIETLETFFNVLIEYIMKDGDSPQKALNALDSILPHLYTLAEISPIRTANQLLSYLDKEQEIFHSSKGKKMKKNFPKFHCLILFKIISKIYSVSDFQHPVATPAMIFMCDILSSPYISSYENTISRLFVCKVFCDCVSYSRRYVPEVIFFLQKTLELAFEKNKKFNLYIDHEISMQQKLELGFKTSDTFSDELKISILAEVINILHNYAEIYKELLSYKEIFSPLLQLCSKLPPHYPEFIKQGILAFATTVNSVNKIYKPLTYDNKKPVPLKLFEPNFESKFMPKKNDIKKKRKLVKSVAQKIRREEKSLLREVRRETQVIASEKLRERIEADEERKRKVKQLYQELAMQEGEYKKFMKKKY